MPQHTSSAVDLDLPTIIAPQTFTSSKLRILSVDTDAMDPTLHRGDCVVVLPVTEHDWDGLYAIETLPGAISVVRTSYQFGKRQVRIIKDNPRYSDQMVAVEWFDEHVVGLVVADIKVREANVLRRLA